MKEKKVEYDNGGAISIAKWRGWQMIGGETGDACDDEADFVRNN